MAIIKCPECGHQISEKATVCPSCGVEIAGKIAKCTFCGEVFFKDYGLCPHCYRPYQSPGGSASPTDSQEQEDLGELPGEAVDSTEETVKEPSVADPEPSAASKISAPSNIEPSADIMDEDEEEEEEELPPHSESDTPDAAATPTGVAESAVRESSTKEDTTDEQPSLADDEDTDDDIKYIDTDGEHLEKPEHEATEDDTNNPRPKRGYLPVVVSFAIAALIAAVCLYFYNDSKLSIENTAFNLAYDSGDIDKMNTFLRNHPDATDAHKKAIENKIKDISKQKEDYSMGMVTRDKNKLQQYLTDYPNTPHKQTILAMIDSIDWEEALRINKKEGYDKYIAEHGNGLFIKEAKEKVSVKISEATAEDQSMAKSLYREFFLSVNGNDASRISPTLSSSITQFMGTSNATSSDVIGWMKRQHGEDVSNVIWKLNHDYKITRREQNGKMEYIVEFTAKQTINHKDGHTSNANYKISSNITDNKKISSMTMTKYTPSSNSESSSSSKPSTSSSKPSSGTSSGTSSASKPSSNSQTKSTGSQAKSSSSQAKSSGSQAKSTGGQAKSSGGQAKSSGSQAKSSGGQAKSSSSQAKSPTSSQKPKK